MRVIPATRRDTANLFLILSVVLLLIALRPVLEIWLFSSAWSDPKLDSLVSDLLHLLTPVGLLLAAAFALRFVGTLGLFMTVLINAMLLVGAVVQPKVWILVPFLTVSMACLITEIRRMPVHTREKSESELLV